VQDFSLDDYDNPNFDPTATLLQDESAYVEVRAAVSNIVTDNPRMPSWIFRIWAIGLICAILLSGINQVLFFRSPTIAIDTVRVEQPWISCPGPSLWTLNPHHLLLLVWSEVLAVWVEMLEAEDRSDRPQKETEPEELRDHFMLCNFVLFY
jgi:hypothetical protein